MNAPARHNRRAFTLIELVASAVLASIMMAAMLSISWSALREASRLRQSSSSRFPITMLANVLRSDLYGARGMAIDSSGITLHGFLQRQPGTMRPVLAPATVRYQLSTWNGRRLLMRGQAGGTLEPLWLGCAAIVIDPLASADDDESSVAAVETGGLAELPMVFRVRLLDARGDVLWQEVIDHHAS